MKRKAAPPRKLKIASSDEVKKVAATKRATPKSTDKSGPLDEVQQREILAILSVGGSRSTAAAYVKRKVAAIGRAAERDPDFRKRLRHAESSHEILQLKNIHAAANDVRYWRAAAWALERRYPDRYAVRRAKVLTARQVSSLMACFAAIVIDEIPDVSLRLRIERRLDELAATLHDTKPKKPTSDEG